MGTVNPVNLVPNRCFHVFNSSTRGVLRVECTLAEYQALGLKDALPPALPSALDKNDVVTWMQSFQGAVDSLDGTVKAGDAAVFPNGDVVILPLDGSVAVTLQKSLYNPVLDPIAKTVTVPSNAPLVPAKIAPLVTVSAAVAPIGA